MIRFCFRSFLKFVTARSKKGIFLRSRNFKIARKTIRILIHDDAKNFKRNSVLRDGIDFRIPSFLSFRRSMSTTVHDKGTLSANSMTRTSQKIHAVLLSVSSQSCARRFNQKRTFPQCMLSPNWNWSPL